LIKGPILTLNVRKDPFMTFDKIEGPILAFSERKGSFLTISRPEAQRSHSHSIRYAPAGWSSHTARTVCRPSGVTSIDVGPPP